MSKKVIIPKESLPSFITGKSNYFIRLRLRTVDLGRFSAWSPIFTVNPDYIYTATGSVSLSKATGTVTAVWPALTVKKGSSGTAENVQEYDVWVRWHTTTYGAVDSGTWVYFGKVSSTFVSVSIPAGMSYFSIEIYRPGIPATRSQSNGFKMFSSYDYLAV